MRIFMLKSQKNHTSRRVCIQDRGLVLPYTIVGLCIQIAGKKCEISAEGGSRPLSCESYVGMYDELVFYKRVTYKHYLASVADRPEW